MALTSTQITKRFSDIRSWAAVVSNGQHTTFSDVLEKLLKDLAADIAAIQPTDDDGEPVDLTAILARLDALEAAVAAVNDLALSMHLLDMVPLTAEEILAVVDRYIDTEAGDHLATEDGDTFLLESA